MDGHSMMKKKEESQRQPQPSQRPQQQQYYQQQFNYQQPQQHNPLFNDSPDYSNKNSYAMDMEDQQYAEPQSNYLNQGAATNVNYNYAAIAKPHDLNQQQHLEQKPTT